MATINFPPPSAVLNSPASIAPSVPLRASVKPKPKSITQKKTSNTKTAKPLNKVQDGGVTKPKQSKSRNGCVTCKAKRLKCDERKPTCQQCERRSVTCGGYKKDFKWRSFEENTISGKPSLKVKKDSDTPPDSASIITFPDILSRSGPLEDSPEAVDGSLQSFNSNFGLQQKSGNHEPILSSPHGVQPASFSMPMTYGSVTDNHQQIPTVYPQIPFPFHTNHDTVKPPSSVSNGYHVNHEEPLASSAAMENPPRNGSVFTAGHSPRLEDLLLPGTDMNRPPPAIDPRPPQSPRPYQPSGWSPPQMDMELATDTNDDIEEIIRPPGWSEYRSPSPSPSVSSSSSSSSIKLYRAPSLDTSSPDSLLSRFVNDTCGILSVKDGISENPWRNLIGPLAQDSPALMNAILSMTAFHSSQAEPKLRLTAVTAMNESIKDLITNMDNIRLDTALATTIALAFAEGWDRHTSTGIQHLRGSKALLNNALQNKHQLNGDELNRLRFLSNTWIYMDVIARLTSFNQDESWPIDNGTELESVMSSLNPSSGLSSEAIVEVDPLMGCATTLFPVIGRVASLVQRIRKGEQYSFLLIEQAVELKEQVERWKPPALDNFEEPEDQNSQVQHSLQTAEAYRYATLLYLHQAVPEIPSESSANLADKVLHCLATVPLSSRTTIIHIYPLLAAGCELTQQPDRRWVENRWEIMSKRMRIGNVDKCVEVMKEVWRRRDEFEATRNSRPSRKGGRRMVNRSNSDATAGNSRGSPDLKRPVSLIDTPGELGGTMDGAESLTTNGFTKRRIVANGLGRPTAVNMQVPRDASASRFSIPPPSPSWRAPPDIVCEQLEEEYTVRGPLHWSSVMKDYGWEVFVG